MRLEAESESDIQVAEQDIPFTKTKWALGTHPFLLVE